MNIARAEPFIWVKHMARYLIIGASSGIGLSLAELLSESHEIINISRSESSFSHPNFTQFSLDVQDESTEFPAIDGIDGLVFCPGSINLKPFHRLSMDDFSRDWNLNFLAAVKVLQYYYPSMKKSGKASVVVFSTVAVQRGMPFHASVAGAKGALEGLTRSLAAEWAPVIRVNAIAPSLTDTPMAQALLNTDAKKQSSIDRHPLKRVGTPKDSAEATAWLLSDASSWVTGQVLHVDGGLSVI